jgi:hypothetical protein
MPDTSAKRFIVKILSVPGRVAALKVAGSAPAPCHLVRDPGKHRHRRAKTRLPIQTRRRNYPLQQILFFLYPDSAHGTNHAQQLRSNKMSSRQHSVPPLHPRI